MIEAKSREAFSALEHVDKEIRASYEDVSVGDPRLMALWDLADQEVAKADLNIVFAKRRSGEEVSSTLFSSLITREEMVRNRIDMRSTEVSGYSIGLDEASRHLYDLANARANAYGDYSEYNQKTCANDLSRFARELTKRVSPQ